MLSSVAPLLRSPRQAKRLLNLYRMIRSTRNLGPASRFLGADGGSGEFQAVVILLGLLSAHPTLFDRLPGETESRPHARTWSKLVADLVEDPDWAPVLELLRPATERISLPDLSAFRHWAPHVARFSFVMSAAGDDR